MGDDAAQMREEIAILRSTLEMQTLHREGAKELQAEAAALREALRQAREQHRQEKLEWRETSARLTKLLAFWPEEVSDGGRMSVEKSAQGSNGGGIPGEDLADGAASPVHVAAARAAASAADVRDSSESSTREFGGFSASVTEPPELFEMNSRGLNPLSPKRKSAPVTDAGADTSPERSEEVVQGEREEIWYGAGEAAAAAKATAPPRNGSLLARRTGSPSKALSVVVTGQELPVEKRPRNDVFSPSRSASPVLRSLSPTNSRSASPGGPTSRVDTIESR